MTNQSRSRIASLYGRFCRIANSGQSAFLLLIRVYIGYQCVISGWSHLHNLDKTAQFFASLHIPAPKLNVVMSAMTEIVGGAMMALGLFARPAALVLTGNFIVAMLSVQLSNYDFSFSKLAAPHDFSAAGFGQRIGEANLIGLGQAADLLGDQAISSFFS
jgi:uncharacterized membrane protein YphA (DoxX/SURF4 family)